MECVRCGRPLLKPAKTINSRQGPLMWGRACAIRDGVITPKPRPKALVTHDTGETEADLQMDFFEEHEPA